MNWFTDIFGGSNTTSSSSSTPVNMNPFTSSLSPEIMSMYGQGPMSYGGNLQPNMTGAQVGSLGNLPGMVAPGNNVNSYISNVLKGSYMPGGANGNPFVSATINAANLPIQEQLNTTLGQTLPTQFAASGQNVGNSDLASAAAGKTGGSSAFSNAAALATQSAVNAESANATQIANNAYNTGVSQQIAASNLQPQMVSSAINVLQAQLLPTLLQQQGIQNGLQAFQDNIQSFLGFLGDISGLAMPVIGNNQTSTSTGSSTPGILNDITGIFKGGTGTVTGTSGGK